MPQAGNDTGKIRKAPAFRSGAFPFEPLEGFVGASPADGSLSRAMHVTGLVVVGALAVVREVEAFALLVLRDAQADDQIGDLVEHHGADAGPDQGDHHGDDLGPALAADGVLADAVAAERGRRDDTG